MFSQRTSIWISKSYSILKFLFLHCSFHVVFFALIFSVGCGFFTLALLPSLVGAIAWLCWCCFPPTLVIMPFPCLLCYLSCNCVVTLLMFVLLFFWHRYYCPFHIVLLFFLLLLLFFSCWCRFSSNGFRYLLA